MRRQAKVGALWLVIGVCALVLVLLSACKPPPVKIGPPVSTVQYRPDFPKPLEVRACWEGYDRCFIWHSPRFGTYIWGSIHYDMAGTVLCEYRPEWGDTYYSETNLQVLTPPKGCHDYP